jgi:hypothetical protein
MGVVSTCALSFMSKYLHQSCGPKAMTRADINDNNQSSNNILFFLNLFKKYCKRQKVKKNPKRGREIYFLFWQRNELPLDKACPFIFSSSFGI